MQKLETIEIKNFKSIRDAKIEDCRRVNVFIGYPNVGKSNILEAISLLTFIPENRKPLKLKSLVRHEKLTQFFNYYNIQNPAVIKFNEHYELMINYADEGKLRFNLFDDRETNLDLDSNFIDLLVGEEQIFSSSTGVLDTFSGRMKELQNLRVKPYKFSEEKVYNESYSALELKAPFGRNLFELIVNNKKIQKEFSELLKPYNLELVIDVSSSDVKISPPIKDGIIKTIPISLIADTIIRLVFFKTAIISNKNSVLLFEEPESHMFPPYISKLTNDVIFDENRNQFFMTTHSPFVLNDLMDNLKEDELAVYIVSNKEETGETKVQRMNKDDMHEAYQFGYDFFMNIEKFTSVVHHE